MMRGMEKWAAALRLTGVGFFIGGAIVAGVLVGLWLDSKMNTGPLFVLAGLVVGLVVAGAGVYQMLLPLLRNRQNKENGR
jgi:F0F1-type ATP synthase assembly protein I